MDTGDDGLTIQYLRGRVTSLEADKKKLEEKLNDYQHIEGQLKQIWDIIFPAAQNDKQPMDEDKKDGEDKDNKGVNVDKLREEFNKITHRISTLESNVDCLKNRESELLLKLCESQKIIHRRQTQINILRQELKSQSIRNKKSQFVDPLINYNFNLMLKNINDLNKKLKSSRDETIANGFNLQSQTGRSLIEKCKNLIIENQILGRQIQMNKNSNLTQKIILLHQHNLKLSQHIIKLNMIHNGNNAQTLTQNKQNNDNSIKQT